MYIPLEYLVAAASLITALLPAMAVGLATEPNRRTRVQSLILYGLYATSLFALVGMTRYVMYVTELLVLKGVL